MKYYTCAALVVAALFTSGCASRHTVFERGWVGGEFARASGNKIWKKELGEIAAFPEALKEQYESGLLITELAPESPLAKAGLEETDLIITANGEPVSTTLAFREQVDRIPAGTPLSLRVYRDGAVVDKTIIVGRERYRKERNVTFGLGFSTRLEFDLLPNPDFSLVALGFQRNRERLNLHDTKMDYLQEIQPPPADPSWDSTEAWRTWLGPFALGGHKEILSQEAIDQIAAR